MEYGYEEVPTKGKEKKKIPYEILKCPLLLFAPQPYEEMVPLEKSA